MPRGGARNHSGPMPDERSERSEKRGYTLTALPAEGFKGKVPKFPLPPAKFGAANETPEVLAEIERQINEREAALWAELWRTPQACAWSMPSERWRTRIVAQYCRLSVRCETIDAPATLLAQLHRFADQIGLTTAGLALMGWKVAEDEIAKKRVEKAAPAPARPARRLRAVDGNS